MSLFWGVLAALALLWPDRLSGPLDGVPLDQTAEAILVGLVVPTLLWFHRRFPDTRPAQALIIALLAWRIVSAATFVRDGWCVRFAPERPLVSDGGSAPHAWDLRADWRSADPACSAIMTRSYGDFHDFPAWFFNLPPPTASWPDPSDLPPLARVAMTVHGFLDVREAGLLQLDTGPDIAATLRVDGGLPSGEERVAPGVHRINIDATLVGDRWRFVPRWNGADLWSSAAVATLRRPAAIDLFVRPWGPWIPALLGAALIAGWVGSAILGVRDPLLLAWTAAASLAIGLLAGSDRVDTARWAIAALAGAAALGLPSRLRNILGAFVAIGIPWLVFVAVCSARAIGRFTLYQWGHDFWMFQRFAYRIVMQGYWLEGGSPTFWFQPLYRWIAGLLHLVFGDSSVGEWYWDGACLLAGAMFAFRASRTFAGMRWAIVAAVLPLAVFVLGTPRDLIGRGLGEITSSGLLSLAALFAMRSRQRHLTSAFVAGMLATLGFYTRLNNLGMAIGVAAFLLPPRLSVGDAVKPSLWWPRRRLAARRVVATLETGACLLATLGLGVLFFAWRTWHYTGVFSVFYGTQRDLLAIRQPGLPLVTIVERMIGSVMMVLTVNDPARYDPYALPVLAGALGGALATVGLPRLRELPLSLVIFFWSAIAGALVARGSAYPGRFSVHVIPVTCAIAACAAAACMPRRLAGGRGPVKRAEAEGRSREERIGQQQPLQPVQPVSSPPVRSG